MFNVDSVYIRLGAKGRKVLKLVNNPDEYLINPENPSEIGLRPTSSFSWEKSMPFSEYPEGEYSIEIQPAVIIDKNLVICENAISRQDLKCE